MSAWRVRRESAHQAGLARFAKATAAATFFLLFAGAMVTSTGSGLSVPDWPLSYGTLMPPMVGGIFYEHGHRMVATAVGLLTVILAAWLWRREERLWVRRLGLAALGLVIAQGVLGGLTVLLLLPAPVSSAHATLGQTFFLVTILIAYAVSREWRDASAPALRDSGGAPILGLAWAAIAAVYVQLVLGAAMRHTEAGLAIPDFPLAFGRLVPPFDRPGVAIHYAHRVWGVLTGVAALALAVSTLRRFRDEPRLRRPAALLAALVPTQILLGGATVLTGRSPLVASTHLACGALLLGTAWFLTLRLYRLVRREGAAARPAPLRAAGEAAS